jgi:outer membrane lipoprotein-sorting protein
VALEEPETGNPLVFRRFAVTVPLIILTGLILFPVARPLLPQDAPMPCPALDAARAAMQSMKPFRATFTQQVYYDEELAIEESGDLLFVDPNRIRWTYRDPELKIFLLEAGRYRFYEPEASQLTLGTMTGGQGGWIWRLLASTDADVVESCPPSGKELVLRDPEHGTRFRLRLDRQHRVVQVEHTDSGGARHIYILRDYLARVTVTENDFQLEIPKDTEVVNMDAESP